MALSDKDFKKLQDMQALTAELEADIKTLASFKKYLNATAKRQEQLGQFYQEEWMELVDSEDFDEEQEAALKKMVKKGHYSILDQDTIWDALNGIQDQYSSLLKALVKFF